MQSFIIDGKMSSVHTEPITCNKHVHWLSSSSCQPVWWFCWLFCYHFYGVSQPKPTNKHTHTRYICIASECSAFLLHFWTINQITVALTILMPHFFPSGVLSLLHLLLRTLFFPASLASLATPHNFNRNICHRHIDFTLDLHAFRRVLHFIVSIQRFNFDVNSCFSMFMMTFLHLNA